MATYISPIPAFDANVENKIPFQYEGAYPALYATIYIKNNRTSDLVYTSKDSVEKLEVTIPPNTLENFGYYNIQIQIEDYKGYTNPISNTVEFRCFTTPTLEFTNIPEDNIIGVSTYRFTFTYNQKENELLNTYRMILRNSNSEIIDDSGVQFVQFTKVPYYGQHEFTGLLNKTDYYVELICKTIYDTEVKIPPRRITVDYIQPDITAPIALINNCKEGSISIKSEISIVNGDSDPFPPVYINNKEVDLTKQRTYVEFKKGFKVDGDFILRVWFRKPNLNNIIITLKNERGNVSDFTFDKLSNGKVRVTGVKFPDLATGIYSNEIDPTTSDKYYCLWIKRIDNEYELILSAEGISPVELHNIDPSAHENAKLDAGEIIAKKATRKSTKQAQALNDCQAQVDAHNVNPDAHQNIVIDAGEILPTVSAFSVNAPPTPSPSVTVIKLTNAIFDHLNLTTDTSLIYNDVIPVDWTPETVINANFNGNLIGGSVNIDISQITSIKVKKRLKQEFATQVSDWVTLAEFPINDVLDLDFTVTDFVNANGFEYEYALVPINNNVEGNYIVGSIVAEFNGVFICDAVKSYRLFYNVEYGTVNMNQQVGVLEPFGRKYPVIVSNGNLNYDSSSVSATILNDDYEETGKIDSLAITKKIKMMQDFLNNKKVKILKDSSGKMWLCTVTGVSQVSYLTGSNLEIPNINIEWTEIGDPNNQEDLYDTGLIERIE